MNCSQKTEQDLLIEQKCSTAQQRIDLERLLSLCDYLGVKYMPKHIDFIEELNDFCSENQDVANIEDFKKQCVEFIEKERPVREFDLYFPSKHWVINIGEEQKDVDTQLKGNIFDIPFNERIFLNISFEGLYKKFKSYLTEKYHYPCYDKENESNKTYLPWGRELEHANLPLMMWLNIKTGSVSSFYAQLFKDDIEKARKKSIGDFLAKNPDLQKLRNDMLHDHCNKLLSRNKLELGEYEIQKLLRQTDKDLAALYPEYKEAALM